ANASNTTTQNGQQATTTFDTALAGNKITGTMPQGGVVITTPPTILYDDSAAAPFWDPVPEGMDPADFSPKYLTREEITKYVALPDPDPAAWNIPENGPTPEYAARVLNYIQALRSGLAKAAADLGADNPRVRDSAVAPFRKAMIDSFLDGIDQDASDHVVFYGEWSTTTDLQVQEVQFREVGAERYPCMFVHITFTSVRESATEYRDQWVTVIRDGVVNWLNPTGWREEFTAPSDWPDLASISCDSWGDQ
ncbi:MAG: hypothetical protein KDB86_08605, partial [Actinobacteria bacterium]|nr:hypothetical protein [Actinomycetota bacterium]